MNTTDFMQMSHANCAMQASDMSYEIETLRRQLADMTAQFDAAKAGCETEANAATQLRQKYDQALNRICNLEDMAASANTVIAEKDAEIDRLTTKNLEWLAAWNKDQETITHIEEQLAESHAEVITLRQQKDAMWFAAAESQALLVSAPAFPPSAEVYADWMERVAECRAKSNDTALREMIEKAGECMKERCAEHIEIEWNEPEVAGDMLALPGVTLENLQG